MPTLAAEVMSANTSLLCTEFLISAMPLSAFSLIIILLIIATTVTGCESDQADSQPARVRAPNESLAEALRKQIAGGFEQVEISGDFGAIADATALSFSPNGKLMAIADAARGRLIVVDCKTGEIRGVLASGLWMTDSLEMHVRGTVGQVAGVLIPRTQWRDPAGRILSVAEQRRQLANKFESVAFTSDSTMIIAATSLCVVQLSNGAHLLSGHTTLIKASIRPLEVLSFAMADALPMPHYPQTGWVAVGRDGKIALPTRRPGVTRQTHADSVKVLSLLRPDGTRISDIVNLSVARIRSGLGYSALSVYSQFRLDQLFVLQSSSNRIVEVLQGREIVVSGMPNSDPVLSQGFQTRGPRIYDSIATFLPAQAAGLFIANDGTFIVPWTQSDATGLAVMWSIVEMHQDGREKRTVRFGGKAEGGIVKSVGFNAGTGEIVILSVHSGGKWQMTKYGISGL